MSGKPLVVREISEQEESRFKELSGKFHYMGEGHAGGDTLRLVVECEGELKTRDITPFLPRPKRPTDA